MKIIDVKDLFIFGDMGLIEKKVFDKLPECKCQHHDELVEFVKDCAKGLEIIKQPIKALKLLKKLEVTK